MPSHEIRKGFDLARRFHDAHPSYRSSHLCQFAGRCEDQIGVSDGKDCRHEEWKTKHDTPFRAKLRQRTIRESLLTLQRFDQCVRKVQILFQRKPTGANRLSGTHETDKV
jgi:hypothetical protein